VTQIAKLLIKELDEFDEKYEGMVCGSYRRKKDFSNDIDFLMVDTEIDDQSGILKENHQLRDFVEHLKKKKFILDDMTSGDITNKYMGFCRLDKNHPVRRLDIRLFAVNSFPAAVLYFTGSDNFNKKMRANADKLGYLLNEYGLYKITKKETEHEDTIIKKKFIKVENEKDIFKKLDMKYVSPNKRE
jgi:DNA polymerase/3'-5' exonuclease PolX